MKILIGLVLYLLMGVIGRKVFGYKGLVETMLWPVAIACVVYLKSIEDEYRRDGK